jgi:hypothetical protein
MKPEFLFFIGIDQINLPPLRGKGERFLDKYFLTNDRITIRILLEPVAHCIGSVEHEYLINKCAGVAYRKEWLTESEYNLARDNLDHTLGSELYNISAFTQNLWVVKDNAVCFDRGWLYIRNGS